MLFENEIFNISKIESVICYEPRNHKKYFYSGKLPTYELMYYEKGRAELSFGGKAYNPEADSIILLPRGIENEEYTLSVTGLKPVTPAKQNF